MPDPAVFQTEAGRPGDAEGWNILVVSSSGGVLLDLLALRPWLSRHEVTWVTVGAEDTRSALVGERVRWTTECRASLSCIFSALRSAATILTESQAQLVVSAGTGLAVPFFAVSRARRIPCVWVETFNVIGRPGRAARICSRLAAFTLVQHRELEKSRRRGVFVGELY